MTKATHKELQDIADFDHPFVITADGSVHDAPSNVYAPEVYDAESISEDITIEGDGWSALTGHTGQYGYHGAVMHASEFIGGGLADYLLDNSGTYVVVAVECLSRVTFPHEWSPSGARCVRSGCNVVGAGPGDGSCEAHPNYDADLVDDDEDPEPAGWAILRHDDEPTTCRHCDRPIVLRDAMWASPDADHSDDSEWLCEGHDTFCADHEPVDAYRRGGMVEGELS